MAAGRELGARPLITTEAVLVEFLAALSDKGARLRKKAVETVRAIQRHSGVVVLEQTRELFEAGLSLYDRRPDKSYSLVDGISMSVMTERGLTEVLTHDHHFAQEGFILLL